MAQCAAAGEIVATKRYHACPNEAVRLRYVVCDGFTVGVGLCVAHLRLWDNDYAHLAVHAGTPVEASVMTR